MSFKLCFDCLTPGHSSKICRSSKTCRTCGSHHYSSLCLKAHSNSNSSEVSNSNSVVSQGKSNVSSTSSSSTNNHNAKAQAQSHPNKPVVTSNKQTTSQATSSPKVTGQTSSQPPASQTPAADTTYVTSVNSSSFPKNVLPTATLNVRYCDKQVNVRAFFDMGSNRS